jgi:hypothetical protein
MDTLPKTAELLVPHSDKGDPRLQNLFDYTKFHIALYATLLTLLITALGYIKLEIVVAVKFTIVCFTLAGACGGIVASNAYESDTLDDFLKKPIGIAFIQLPGRDWAHWEHFFFWVGIIVAIVSILFAAPSKPVNCWSQTLVL